MIVNKISSSTFSVVMDDLDFYDIHFFLLYVQRLLSDDDLFDDDDLFPKEKRLFFLKKVNSLVKRFNYE